MKSTQKQINAITKEMYRTEDIIAELATGDIALYDEKIISLYDKYDKILIHIVLCLMKLKKLDIYIVSRKHLIANIDYYVDILIDDLQFFEKAYGHEKKCTQDMKEIFETLYLKFTLLIFYCKFPDGPMMPLIRHQKAKLAYDCIMRQINKMELIERIDRLQYIVDTYQEKIMNIVYFNQ